MMEQDKRLTRLPKIRIPAGFSDREMSKDIKKPLILYVENLGLSFQYSDYLLQPFSMVGERIHSVMEKHQRDLSFRRIILVDKKTGTQHRYYRIFAPVIDCVSAVESGNSWLGEKPEPVIDVGKVKDTRIFLAKQFKETLFVRLDAAESILRREPEGIWFRPVRAALSAASD